MPESPTSDDQSTIAPPTRRTHSREAIVSALIPAGIVIVEILGGVIAAAIGQGGPGAKGGFFLIGFFSCVSFVGAVAGLIFGIVGLRSPEHAKTVAILGIVLNSIALGLLGILIIRLLSV